MYKKQIKVAKTSGSVINLNKKKIKTCDSAKNSGGSRNKNESAERMEDKGKYLNHFHPDVPEQVQEFIKRISSDSKPNEDKLENLKHTSLPIPYDNTNCIDDDLPRTSSVQVIVTTDFTPNCLSNTDYDRLKEVGDILWIFSTLIFLGYKIHRI